MTRITIDSDLRKKLLNCATPLELCDEAGLILARLTPSTPWTDPDKWEELTPPVSKEELQRRLNSNEPTYSTKEVMDMIRKASN
jgi:hypothetical protein